MVYISYITCSQSLEAPDDRASRGTVGRRDSAVQSDESRVIQRNVAAGGGNAGAPFGPPGEVRIVIGGPGGGAPGGPGAFGGREPVFVAPSELPDYQPAFFVGAVRADAEGRLWIRTTPTKSFPGGPVYDVINTKGELVERVQVPKDRTIVGFGEGGIVFLLVRDPTGTTTKLEQARVK